MTAPINFPTLNAPQVVQRPRSQLDGFAEFLNTLSEQRNNRAVQREQLDNARRNLENSETMDKFTRDKTKREQDLADLALQADELADPYARIIATDPNASEQTISSIIGKAVSENKKHAPYMASAIIKQVQGLQQTLTATAQSKSAQSKAKVDTATEDARIAAGNLEDDVQTAQLTAANNAAEASRLGAILTRDQINLDPARRSQISQFMAAGKTIGESYTAVGRDLPAGVDPNFKLDILGATGGQDARKQKGLAAQAELGRQMIRNAGNVPLSVPADVFRTALGKDGVLGTLSRSLANKALSPEERQVVQGYMTLGQAYMVHVTGATATNTQSQVFMNTMAIFKGDDPKTVQQKIAFQNLLPSLIAQGLGPADIANAMLNAGLETGMSKDKIKALQAAVPLARKYESSPEYQQKVKGAGSPADAVNGALSRAGIRPPTP